MERGKSYIPNYVRTIHILGGLRKWRVQLVFPEFGLWKPRDPHHTIPGIKIQISSDHLPHSCGQLWQPNEQTGSDVSGEERPDS
jgi:hypothetical protein